MHNFKYIVSGVILYVDISILYVVEVAEINELQK